MSRASEFANSVSQLYAQQGNAAANASQQRGNIWGTTLSNLGGMIAGIPQQRAQARRQGLQDYQQSLQIQNLESEQQKKAALQQWAQQYGGKIDETSIAALAQIDPPSAMELQERVQRADLLAAQIKKAELEGQLTLDEAEARIIASADPNLGVADWGERMLTIQRLGRNPARYGMSPNPSAILSARRQLGDVPKAPEPYTLNPGDVRFGPDNQQIAAVPAAVPQPPAPQPFTLNPGDVRFGADGKPLASVPAAPRAPVDDRLVQIMGPQGTPIWVREADAVGKPAAQAARAVTGQERQALAFYNRAKDAVDTLTTANDMGASLEDRVAKSGVTTQLGLKLPNYFQSGDQQAYTQAQRAFTEARLRKESGAAIPAGEYQNDAQTYFAQPGDTPALIDQKRKARQVVLDGLKFGSGKAFDEFYGGSANQPDKSITRAELRAVAASLKITEGAAEAQAIQRGLSVVP